MTDAAWNAPRAETVVDMIARPARDFPDRPALYLWEPDAPPTPVRWLDLWNRAREESNTLRHAGLQPGDRVLLVAPTQRAFFDCFFGILLAGGIPAPVVPPGSPRAAKKQAYAEHLHALAIDSGASILVGPSDMADDLGAAAGPQVRVVSPGSTSVALAARPEPAPSDIALLQYTSGSTSRPKGVVLTHANIIANVAAIADAFVEPDSSGVSWLPLYHDMGLIGALFTSLYCRRPVVFMPAQAFVKEPAAWLRCISDFRASVTMAPNFAFSWCVRNVSLDDIRGARLDSLKVALNGAEPVDTESVRSFEEKFAPLGLRPGTVRPVYGLAESTLAVTFTGPDGWRADTVDADAIEQEHRATLPAPGRRAYTFVSVGRPIATQQIRIERDGAEMLERATGEVLVRGPSVMQGYFQRPEDTAAALRDGWLHTGDLGYIADGELYLVGRAKDLIIRHGRNYPPQDIESRVGAIEGIAKGGVAAFNADREGGAIVVVVAETRVRGEEARVALEREIRTRCHDAFLFGPDEIVLAPPAAIPRTSSGKIRRAECVRMYQDGRFASEPTRFMMST